MSDDPITRLQEKVAYLERHVTEQDKAMLEFADELARLRLEVTTLKLRLSATGAGGAESAAPTDERPPHY